MNKLMVKDSREIKLPSNGTYSKSEVGETVLDELIISTFPSLKIRERIAVACTIQTIWDIPFSVAFYDEVVYRLKLDNKKLFYSKKVTDRTISDLCKRGILKSEISYFGSPGKWKESRVLKLSEAFREKSLSLIAGMSQSRLFSSPTNRRL